MILFIFDVGNDKNDADCDDNDDGDKNYINDDDNFYFDLEDRFIIYMILRIDIICINEFFVVYDDIYIHI